MSNYSKTTDFAAKDSLPSGDSGKIIRGSEFETEFDNISTAIATKADAADPTFTGTVTIDGLTVNGNTVLGNAATDTVTVTADIASNLIPSADDTYNLGASGAEWNDLFIDGTANIDSLVADTADINGGTVDGVTIGGSSAGAITGTTITGTSFVTSGDMTFGDNDKAIFGAGSDLEIYHDGSNSYITEKGTGNLRIQANDFELKSFDTNEVYMSATTNADVSLRYNNNVKLATTNTGVDVTGTATVDGLTVDGVVDINSSNPQLYMFESDSTDANTLLWGQGSAFRVVTVDDAESSFTQRFRVDHTTGDVSFYEDTGTTAKFFWDASNEALGIGTASVVSSASLTTQAQGSTELSGMAMKDEAGANTSYVFVGGSAHPDPDYRGHLNLYADNELKMYTNASGTPKVVVDTSGNVGIGTSSPASALEVVSSITGGAPVFSASGTDHLSAIVGTAGGGFSTVTGNYFSIWHQPYADRGTQNNLTERMRIDSSGNVGIGTDSPSEKLEVSNGSTSDSGEISIRLGGDVDNNARTMTITKDTSTPYNTIINTQNNPSVTSGSLIFKNGSTEQMRINSSGNVLVSTTDTSPATNNIEGICLRNEGHINVSRASGVVGYFNRKTDDGTILDLRKDGGQVGTIGSNNDGGSKLFIGSSASAVKFKTNAVVPCTNTGANNNNDIDLGENGTAFKDLYLSGGAYIGGVASANKLDDYEEGTWTPALGSVTAGPTEGASATYSGSYVKVGKMVHVFFEANLDDSGTNIAIDDRFTLSGLPFAVEAPTYTSVGTGLFYFAVGGGTNAFANLAITEANETILVYVTHIDGTIDYGKTLRAEFTYEVD